jgi:hypothetical protein
VSTPDQDTLLRAIERPAHPWEIHRTGPARCSAKVQNLLAVLDKNEVVLALDRLKRQRVVRLVE